MTLWAYLNDDRYHKHLCTNCLYDGKWELMDSPWSGEEIIYFGNYKLEPLPEGSTSVEVFTEVLRVEHLNNIVSDLVHHRIQEYKRSHELPLNIGVGRLGFDTPVYYGNGDAARDALKENGKGNSLAHVLGSSSVIHESGMFKIEITSMFYMPHKLYGESIDELIVDQLNAESSPSATSKSLDNKWIDLAILSYVRQQLSDGSSKHNLDSLRQLLLRVTSASAKMIEDVQNEIDRLDKCITDSKFDTQSGT